MNVYGTWKKRLSVLLIAITIAFAVSACTTQGNNSTDPAPDAVHQMEDDGTAIYDENPIAEEPQMEEIE